MASKQDQCMFASPVHDVGIGEDHKLKACGIHVRDVHDLVLPVSTEAGVVPGGDFSVHNSPGLIPEGTQ